ncbi:MAG: two-component regulator propeller domain-containing protein [bacterium]
MTKILKIKLLMSFVLFFVCSLTYAQILSFRNLTVEDGLAQNSIISIIQDKDGFIWFASEAGVSKYDGVSFQNYNKLDGLSDDHVRVIFEDSKGNKWFGTNDGITKYDGKKFYKYLYGNENNSTIVYSICEDNKGVLWFVTGSSGLLKLDKKGFSYYSKENGLPTDSLRSCFADKNGVVWVGTVEHGVFKIVNSKITIFEQPDWLNNASIYSIYEDKKGNKWFGTDSGIILFDGNKFIDFEKKTNLFGYRISSIIEDKSNILWFCSYGNGLISYNGNKFVHYGVMNGLTSDRVLCSLQDTRGDLWFGTQDGGVCKLSIEKFKIYNTQTGLADDAAFSIFKDNFETLWLGHFGLGISQINSDGVIKILNKKNGLVGNDIPSIIGDKRGYIWIASFDGVMKFKDNKYEHINTADGLANNQVVCLYQDSKNNIWFGCQEGGISEYDDELKKLFTLEDLKNVFGSIWIYNIFEDTNGNIWFATDGKGVFKYFGGRLTQFNSKNGLGSNFVFSTTQDRLGNLWFATQDAGMVKYDGKKFSYINVKEGLPSNNCYFAVEHNNFLYIGTNQGLVKFDYQNYEKLKKDAFKTYTAKDGLASSEMNAGAVYKDKHNNLYIGTSKGVTYFNLNDQPNLAPSPIYLKNLRIIDDEKISDVIPKDELQLSYTQNNLRFDFISVGFTAREKFVYKHKLIGLESNWVESTEPYAQYPYLPPGKYTFQIISRNADGVWNTDPATFAFEINPPIWQTWWAITIFIFISISSVYGFYLMKTEQVKKRNIELANMVRERTKDLELEKDKSDELLLNILPSSLVQELKSHGTVLPREFKNSSILFTDFKAFTFTASILPADKLVNELNEIFLGFDRIVGLYGLEKLKTIGDSYMAAGGLPTESEDHAIKVVYAALKMQEFIMERNETAALKWEMRAGVHSGQVIAGVVGTKKFTYDIWGDTVNIASRMESSGEPTKVNISAFTYMLVKDYFTCEYRGKIDAKGKGKMDMYFVTGIKDAIYKVFDVDHINK